MSLHDYIRDLESKKNAAEEKKAKFSRDTSEAQSLSKLHGLEILADLRKFLEAYGFQAPIEYSTERTIYTNSELGQKLTLNFSYDGALLLNVALNGATLGSIEIQKGSRGLLYSPSTKPPPVSPEIRVEKAFDALFPG